MKRYRWAFMTLFLAAAVVGYWGLSSLVDHLSNPTVDELIPVKLERVKRGTINHLLKGSGKIEPLTRVDVVSTIPGQVQEIRYNVGDIVSEGQVVATIRSKELLQRVQREELSWKEAQAVLSERQRHLSDREEQLERARQFRKQDFISTRELEQAETAAETARAQHEVAKAQLAQREAALAQSRYLLKLGRLVAPVSGVVVARPVEPGATVSSSMAILTVADLDRLKVVVDLTEKDASLVRKGTAAQIEVDDFPDRLFEGKVAGVNSTSEAANPTLQAEVQLPNRNRLLRPGMVARIEIFLGSDEALLVPAAAVIAERGTSYVYVIVDSKAIQRLIRTGWEQERHVAVAGDISEGELVVVSGQQQLRPNSKVRVLGN